MSDKKPYDIGDIFRQMELDLIANMRKVFHYHEREEGKEGFKWEQWQRAKLRAITEYRKRNNNIVNSYTDKIIKNVDEELGRNYREGENNFIGLGKRVLNKVKSFFGLKNDEIKVDPKMGIPVDTSEQQKAREYISYMRGQSPTIPEDNSFFKLNDKKLEALQKVVKNDLKKAQSSVLRKMDDVYRQTIFKSQVYLQSGATTVYKAVDMATKDFLNKGIDSITYSNGSKMNIASYAEMCLRTANHRATLLGEGKKRDEFGIHLVVVSAHANTCPKCASWQGKVLVDDVFSHPSQEYIAEYSKKYPLLSEAIKVGLLHPNCRHTLATYFEGITNLPKVPDEKEAADTYKAEQKQREMEREIRKYKRIAEGSCDEGNLKYAEDKVKELEKELKSFLKLHAELRRAPERENTDIRSIQKINYRADLKEYEQYRDVLKDMIPESFDKYQELKYNDFKAWNQIKDDFKIVKLYKVDFGNVLPEKILELDKLAFEAKRKNQISKYKKQGNFAVLEYKDKIKFSSSRIAYKSNNEFLKYKGNTDDLVLLNDKRIFTTSSAGDIVDGKINEIPRYLDTEAKFFEYLSTKVEKENIKEIFMLSEKAMCESCKGVAKQFIEKYPNVKVNVASGKTFDGWKGRD